MQFVRNTKWPGSGHSVAQTTVPIPGHSLFTFCSKVVQAVLCRWLAVPPPPADEEIADQQQVQGHFKAGEDAPVVVRVPIADGAGKAGVPVEGEEKQGAVVVVGENVDPRAQGCGQSKPDKPVAPHRSPAVEKQTGDKNQQKNQRGVKEIVGDNPERVVEKEAIEGFAPSCTSVASFDRNI